MGVVALVLSALVLASLHHEVHSQCGSWVQSSYTVGEGDNFVTLTAQFSSASSQQRFLQWSTREDSATAGGDYIGGSGILTFNGGDLQEDALIFVVDNQDSEPTESFFVDLTLLDGTLCDTTTIVILDDEPTPPPPTTPPPNQRIEWEESKYTISESTGGGVFEICARPVGSLSSAVTVTDVTVEGVTAEFAQDFFTGFPTQWTFTDSTAQCITLFIINDNVFEGPVPETIRASFFQEGFGIQETIICIVDDEPVIAIEWELDLYKFDEGGNTTTYQICAVANDTIVGDRIEERLVVFRDDTAIAGEDYVDPGPASLLFRAGDSRICVPILILDDNMLESMERFYVDLVSFVEGIENSTTEVRINDDEGEIVINVEREIYTVVEGNYLEVCVVIADGDVAVFPFNVTGHVYFFGLRIYFYIYFSIGDTRRCDTAFFPGNDYLDKLEREVEIYFIVEDSQFSDFIEFERDSAWLFVADDDIVSIGFAEPTYTALEDGGSVRVCLELCEGSINRPIDVLLYTDDGSALEGINYEGGVKIVTLLAYGAVGDRACTNITILDDGVPTSILDFSLQIYISDTHVLIPDDKANATVFIQPAFEICFDMDTPRVNGSELFLSFESTVPVDAAVCSVDSLPDQDCTNGSALFIFTDATRTEEYTIRIEATFGSETRVLENSVRSELTDVCDVHLVNKGVIFNGNNATIYLQPTGPDPDDRITDLECRCRENESVFTPCPSGSISMNGIVHFDFPFPEGCTRLSVRPIQDGRCSPRRAIQIIPPLLPTPP